MKTINVFRIWLWANLMIGFLFIVFLMFSKVFKFEDIGWILISLSIGFILSLPSIIALMIFKYFYIKINSKNNFVPYILVIITINVLYFITYYFSTYYFEAKWIYFFLLTTFCGIVAFYIEYNNIKKENTKVVDSENKLIL